MPIYQVIDNQTGRTLKVEGATPPTPTDIEEIFTKLAPADSGPALPKATTALGRGAERRLVELEAQANNPSQIGSFLRGARENIGAGVGGALAGAVAGGKTGAALGAMGLNPITVGAGTIGGALIGGVAGGFGGQKLQQAFDPITPERQSALALDMEVNPISSMAGQVAPALITGKPSISNIRNALTPLGRATNAAERAAIIGSRINLGAEAGISGGFDVGQALATGQPMDPRQIAMNAAAGVVFSDPNRIGRALGQGGPITASRPVDDVANYVAPMEGDGLPVQGPLPRQMPVMPQGGPITPTGPTRLAGDLATQVGIDPLTLQPSGADATVTPNDVRNAASRIPATTLDSGGTTEIPFTRKPDPTITELIGSDVEWEGNAGKIIDDEGRPSLQLADGSIMELPFSYGTDRALADLGVKPIGERAQDRDTATRLFGESEQESLQTVFGRLDNTTDDLLDIAELGASMKKQKGKASIPVRDTPEFAATARGVTDEQILIAQEQVNQAIETAKNAPGLTNETRAAIIDKLTGDLDNISALSAARDTWQRQRLPLPTRSPEPPSQRASLAASDAIANAGVASRLLNEPNPQRPTAPQEAPLPVGETPSPLPEPAGPLPKAPEPAKAQGEVAVGRSQAELADFKSDLEMSGVSYDGDVRYSVQQSSDGTFRAEKSVNGVRDDIEISLPDIESAQKVILDDFNGVVKNAPTPEPSQLTIAVPEKTSNGMSVEEAKAYLAERSKTTIMGIPTEEFLGMQYGKKPRTLAPLTPNASDAAPPLTRKPGPEETGIAPVAPESGESLAKSPAVEIPSDKRDSTYEGLIKKGKPAGPNMVELTDSQVTPAVRNKLASDRDLQRGLPARPQETTSFYLRPKADVTGVPTDRGWILKDKRPDFISRSRPTESRTSASSRTADTVGVEAEARKLVGDTENLRVVNEPDAGWEARVKGDTIEVNAAKVGPEGVRSAMHEEIGHVLFRDENERANFQRLHNSLDPETKQKISDTVEKLYSDASPSIKAEEKLVKALRSILDRTPEGRTFWQKLMQKARQIFKRLTGQAAKDPEMIAAAMLKRGIGAVKKGSDSTEVRYSKTDDTAPAEAATPYRTALDSAKEAIAAGESIKSQAKAVLKEIEALPKGEQKEAKVRMWAELDEALLLGRGNDRQFKVELSKIAQEMKGRGINQVTDQALLDALAKKFPDQKKYLKNNFDRMLEEMIFAKESFPDSKSEFLNEWTEYVGGVGEFVGGLKDKMKDGDGWRRARRGLELFRQTYFNGIGGKMHALADGKLTGKKSEALREYFAKITGTRANQDGVNFQGVDGLAEADLKRMMNGRLGMDAEINAFFKASKLPPSERQAWLERVSDHIVTPSRDGELANQPELKKAVDFFIKRRRERLEYLREAGVDVGDAGERSLGRSPDTEKIINNPKEFVEQAAKAYRAKWANEVRELRKQAAELKERGKTGDAEKFEKIQKEISEIQGRDPKEAAEKYHYAISSAEQGISSNGNDITANDAGHQPSFLKKREFGPEADEFLGKFYHRNIAEMDANETVATVRAATKARVLADKSYGNKIDPVGAWKKLREKLEAEGNEDMVPIAAQLVKDYLNLNGPNNETARKALGYVHNFTQLAYLSHATVASLGEPTLIGARTGRVTDSLKAYGSMAAGIARALRKAGPDEIRILNRELGIVVDDIGGLMASHSLTDAFGGRGAGGNLVSRFHKLTGLTGWTNLTFDTATRIGKSYISAQTKLAKAAGSMSKLAMRDLNELGISRADIDTLDAFIAKLDKATDQNSLILGDGEGAALYRKALTLFHQTGAALNPTRGTRAQKANNPVAGMYYQLQSFLYDFHQKVTLRQVRRAKDMVRGKVMIDGKMEDLSTAERAKIAGDMMKAVASIYATQYAVQMLRETILVDPERNKRDKEKKPGEVTKARMLAAASRTGVLGPYDTLFNIVTSARFQREPATVVLGPAVGGASELFQSIVNLYGERNSPNTNTAERKLARTAYNMTVAPGVNALASTMPMGAIPAALIQAIRHPIVREAAVESIAGPIKSQKKKADGPLRF